MILKFVQKTKIFTETVINFEYKKHEAKKTQ